MIKLIKNKSRVNTFKGFYRWKGAIVLSIKTDKLEKLAH